MTQDQVLNPDAFGTVIIIDDDTDTLATLKMLVNMEGFACETYTSASAYLALLLNASSAGAAVAHHSPSCIFCDVNMPELTGIEFQAMIADRKIPMVLMSGDVSVKDVIQGFRLGIQDFLMKPIVLDAFLDLMHRLLAMHQQQIVVLQTTQSCADKVFLLTPREREVARHLVAGEANLAIAQALSISLRTVKFHRKNIYEKMGISSIAQLVQIHQIAAI